MNGSENNTPQTSVGFAPPLLIAVVALLGIFGLQLPLGQRQGVKSPTAETPTPQPTEEKNRDGRQFPPLVLLEEYLNYQYQPEKSSAKPIVKSDFAQSIKLSIPPLATNPLLTVESKTSVASPSLSNTQTKTWRDELSEVLKKSPQMPQMKCLIATVPDPIDSHFQLMFDNTISAICRGFESHGFVLDRHMLLWQDEIRRTTKEDPQSTARRRRYQITPSAILFRGKGEIVMLLLVGETPTAGIHKEALVSALDFVAAYEKVTTHECPIQIRLLGPEFSGSSASLQFAILDWWEKLRENQSGAKVEIISGSATSFKNRETLTFPVRPQGGKPSDAPGLEVEFSATVVPDDVALQGILEHLTDTRRIPWDKILALVEANSGYGQQILGYDQQIGEENPKIGEKKLRTLPFPMALSRLLSRQLMYCRFSRT